MSQAHTDFSTIGLLGLGTMGAGIAQLFAESGRAVIAVEADEDRAAAGIALVTDFLNGGVRRGKLEEDDKSAVLGRIRTTTSVEDLADVDLVIESVSENLEVKRDLLARAASAVSETTPIVTNTSALSVTELAAAVPAPGRFAGLHFFNPAPVMSTVEVVRGLDTADELVDRLAALVDTLEGKVAVTVDDRPGFLVNALFLPYLNDVIQELEDELASPEDIDTALKLGLGYKSGPLELLDMIGLDVHLHATEAAFAATKDARYAPPPLLRKMVAAGRLGTKSGRGFRNNDTTRDE